MARTGRPLRLKSVVKRDDAGNPITAEDEILRWISRGSPFETAAAAVGIPRESVHDWMRQAARIRERQTVNPRTYLTRNEQHLLEFSYKIDKAVAEAEARCWDTMQQMADGGLTTRKRTVKLDAQNNRIEQTVTEETRLPSFTALKWVFENRFNKRTPIEIVVQQGTLSDDERARELAQAIGEWVAERAEIEQRQAAAIDVADHVNENGHAG